MKIVLLLWLIVIGLTSLGNAAVERPSQGPGPFYAMGLNNYGQLGGGMIGDIMGTPTQISIPTTSSGTPIVVTSVAAGKFHSIIVSDQGNVYSVGANSLGQLGLGDFTSRSRWALVAAADTARPFILSCSGGGEFSVCITDGGLLQTWGDNTYGQLGLNDYFVRAVPYTPDLGVHFVQQVAAGDSHVLAVSREGLVLSWGWNKYGQLGLGDQVTRATATLIAAASKLSIVQSAAGAVHSILLTVGGDVYTFGNNRKGQLGLATTDNSPLPLKVSKHLPGVFVVAAVGGGGYHSICVTDAGELWAWGANDEGQLGVGVADLSAHPSPQRVVAGRMRGTILAAGRYHSLAVVTEGYETDSRAAVLAWGHNDGCLLGVNCSLSAVPVPAVVVFPVDASIVSLAAGGAKHSMASLQFGRRYKCGYDKYGFYVCGPSVRSVPSVSTDTDESAAAQVTPQDADNIKVPPF